MAPGEFRAVSKNTMQSVAPNCSVEPRPFFCAVQGPVAVMNSWSGGAFDTTRNMLLITGGGHNDYAGNEVYTFDLKTLSWARATEPSPIAPTGTLGADGKPDGSFKVTDGTQAPISFHSYDGLVYVPTIDHLFALPQASYQSGNSYDQFAYLWDPATKAWQRSQKAPIGVAADRGCDFDATANEVICTQPNGRMSYSIANRTWRLVSNWDDQDIGRTSAIDQNRRLFCSVWKQTAPLACYDLTNNDSHQLRKSPAFTGNTGFTQKSNSGLAWRPKDGRFYAYPGCNEVYAISTGSLTDTWASTRYASSTGPACDPNQVGIYGKWQYAPALDVFVFVRAWNEPVYFYKPNEGPGDTADTTPKVLPSTLVAALQDGQTIDLPKGEFSDCLVVKANNVTVRGFGTTFRGKACEGGVAGVITRGQNVRIEGVAVRDVLSDGATSCFGIMDGSATLYQVSSQGCGQGLRTGKGDHISGTVTQSYFGPTTASGQLQHGFYVDMIGSFTLTYTTVLGCDSWGHAFKSRAKATVIDHAVIAQLDNRCSRVLDFSNGGNNSVTNSFLEHGRKTDNPDVNGFGREGGYQYPDGTIGPDWGGVTTMDGNTVVLDWNDPAYVPGPHWANLIVATVGGTHRAVLKNNRVVFNGKPWAAMLTTSPPGNKLAEDGGGNTFVIGRAAAGLPEYPALPTIQ
jgi:hypothetical protein